jgi:hypothetical protein
MVHKALIGAALMAGLAAALPSAPAQAANGRHAAFIGGLVAGGLLGAAVADRPRYYYGYAPAYSYPYPYYTPPPRYVYPRPAYCGYPPYPPCY